LSIVFAAVVDPVGASFAESLARPGATSPVHAVRIQPEAERLCSVEIDDELKLGGLLDRKVGRSEGLAPLISRLAPTGSDAFDPEPTSLHGSKPSHSIGLVGMAGRREKGRPSRVGGPAIGDQLPK